MTVKNLTQEAIEAARSDGSTKFVRDGRVTGLILAVNKTSKTYKVQRDMWREGKVKTVHHTLGSTHSMTLDEARTRAQEVTTQIRRGIDPNARRDAEGLGVGIKKRE